MAIDKEKNEKKKYNSLDIQMQSVMNASTVVHLCVAVLLQLFIKIE